MMHRVAALGFKGISYAFGCKVLNGISVRSVPHVAENNYLCNNYIVTGLLLLTFLLCVMAHPV